MTKAELIEQIQQKKSFLCVGLDPDMDKIPAHLLETADPIFEFNKAIIDATHPYCVAYKPNIAFYECYGSKGWDTLQKTLDYIPKECLTIADGKRGDIGNTAKRYAKTFFETYGFDAATVAPYMGLDSITPFLEYSNKWTIVLGLTSNASASDFELQELKGGEYLFEKVIETCNTAGNDENMMFVAGATQAHWLQKVRAKAPNSFLLVPGVGAQGATVADVADNCLNKDVGVLINATRSVIYAGNGLDFKEYVSAAAIDLQQQMEKYIG